MKTKRILIALAAILTVAVAFAAGNVLPTIDALAPLTSRDRHYIIESFEQFASLNRMNQLLMERSNFSATALYFRGRAEGFEEASELVLTWPTKQP
jgi:phage tail sheath gpL-like